MEDLNFTLNSSDFGRNISTAAPPPMSQTTRFLMIGLGVLIMIMNSTSIVMVVRARQQLQATVRYGIVSLCVSDIVVGLAMMMTRLWSELSPAGRIYCLFQSGASVAALLSSCLTLVLLSLERCFATVKPIQFRVWITRERKLGALVAIWVFCFFLGALIFYQEADDSRPKQVCMVITYAPEHVGVIWVVVTMTSFIVVFISYIVILCRLRHRRRQIEDSSGSGVRTHQHTVSAHDRKSIQTIGILIVVAAFGYIPLASIVAWILHSGWYTWHSKFNSGFQIASFMTIGNSFLNPLVYVWQTKRLRFLPCRREESEAPGTNTATE